MKDRCIQRLNPHGGLRVGSIAWSNSSDGSRIASSTYGDFAVKIWHLATQEYVELELDINRAHPNMQDTPSRLPLSWSLDDNQIASAFGDHIAIFDTTTGDIIRMLSQSEGHDSQYPSPKSRFYTVESMAWSLHGDRFASASDGCILIWNPTTGECLKRLAADYTFVQFDKMTSNFLKTRWGVIDLDALRDEAEGQKGFLKIVTIGYGIYGDSSWITWKNDALLWLPAECRPSDECRTGFDVSGERVTLGTASGHVLVFWLAPDPTSMFG